MIKKKLSSYLSSTKISVAVLTAAMSYNAHAQQGYGCKGYSGQNYSDRGYNDRGYFGKGYSRPGYYGDRRYGGGQSGMASDSRDGNRSYGNQGYGYDQPGYGASYQRPASPANRYSASPGAGYQPSEANYVKASVTDSKAVEQAVPASEIDVLITGMQFTAATRKVKVGEEVVWRNTDAMPHTVTSTDGGPLNSGQLGKGGEYSFTFKEPGTYSYYCSYHPSMKGTIIVE
ncbi:MAG: hypothetical protein HKP22_06925 [Gammaproteobacteria bacterium]|nr:hypothetical protein [Gammaproteobacteria bacterium]